MKIITHLTILFWLKWLKWLKWFIIGELFIIVLTVTTDYVNEFIYTVELYFKITVCCLLVVVSLGENSYTITVTRNDKERDINIGFR